MFLWEACISIVGAHHYTLLLFIYGCYGVNHGCSQGKTEWNGWRQNQRYHVAMGGKMTDIHTSSSRARSEKFKTCNLTLCHPHPGTPTTPNQTPLSA